MLKPKHPQLDLFADWATRMSKLPQVTGFAALAMRELQNLIIERNFSGDEKAFITYVRECQARGVVIVPDDFILFFNSLPMHHYLRVMVAAMNGDKSEAFYWDAVLSQTKPEDFTMSPGFYDSKLLPRLEEGRSYYLFDRIKAFCHGVIDASKPPEAMREAVLNLYGGVLPRERIQIVRFTTQTPMVTFTGAKEKTSLWFSHYASGAVVDSIN